MRIQDEAFGLEQLGWEPARYASPDAAPDPTHSLARVGQQHRGSYIVLTPEGETTAVVSGRLRHRASGPGDLPVVGDWVFVTRDDLEGPAVIHDIVPRRTKLARKVAGMDVAEQVLAANVDFVFVVCALNQDLNARRVERYLTLIWESGASPVIILSKSDLCDDMSAAFELLGTSVVGVPVHVTSDVTGVGFDELTTYLEGHQTVAVLGSSGVGKSTLINRLVGSARLLVKDIRDDGKGRHTTTHRELVVLPSGGIIIDTPGMRELQLWDGASGIDDAFADVAELALDCRFRDCRHESEPGCAVTAAAAGGTLSPKRLGNYRKMQRELAYLERKRDRRLAAEEAKKWRVISKSMRSDPRAER